MRAARARRSDMVRLIAEGIASAEALSARLDVSLSTVRRDLARLAGTGALLRTYGGAAVPGSMVPGQVVQEQSFADRAFARDTQKKAIARLAAEQVRDGDTIILDAGSTVGALATALRDRESLRVVTNSLFVLQTLAGRERIELVGLGGTMRPLGLGFAGPLAEQAMRRLTGNSVFLGCDGVVAGRGLCEASAEQASLKELMIAQAERVFVLATAEKLGLAASRAWAPLEQPWTLVTDAEATEAALAPFRALQGVTVLQVGLKTIEA